MIKNIVVTGTNRGLGLFLADEYLRKAATVFALNRHQSNEEARLFERYPDRYYAIECDINHEAQIEKAVNRISAETDSIDILINNAGIHLERPYSDDKEMNSELIKQTFQTNSIAPLMIVKYFFPLITSKPGNMIVNISSEAGSIGTCWRDTEFGYCMSKAALNMMSAILQNKVKQFGVKVLSVHPGWVRTDMGGEKAPLDPAAAAANVISAIADNKSLDAPVFIDHTGRKMDW